MSRAGSVLSPARLKPRDAQKDSWTMPQLGSDVKSTPAEGGGSGGVGPADRLEQSGNRVSTGRTTPSRESTVRLCRDRFLGAVRVSGLKAPLPADLTNRLDAEPSRIWHRKNTSQAAIRRAKKGERWGHQAPPPCKGERSSPAQFPGEDRKAYACRAGSLAVIMPTLPAP